MPKIQVTDLGDRVAVDVLGATITPTSGTVTIENEVITGVRYSQHDITSLNYGYPHTVRFVIDLKDGASYSKNLTVETEVGGVRITSYNTETPDVPDEPIPSLDPSKKTVCIDPGHGGSASGAYYDGVMEKDLTLPMSLYLKAELEKAGYNVIMTRDTDVYMTLTERCQYANNAGADIFVSIHCNALANNTNYQGLFTFYSTGSTKGQRLAQYVQDATAEATGAINRGVQSNSDYTVLRKTNMPAILIETGFMSSPEELAKLSDSSYQKKMAQGIAAGIDAYFRASGS